MNVGINQHIIYPTKRNPSGQEKISYATTIDIDIVEPNKTNCLPESAMDHTYSSSERFFYFTEIYQHLILPILLDSS